MDKKQSQFTTVSTLDDSDFVPVFGAGTNKKISVPNLFDQIKDETQIFIYPTIEQLQTADLVADTEWPIYVRVEETEYRLYKITSLAAGANDIELDNGTTATFQEEFSEIGFVVGPDESVDGALAVFSGTTGTQLENGPVPTTIGESLIETPDFDNTGYIRINPDNSTTIRSVSNHKIDLSIDQVSNTSDANKPLSNASVAAFSAVNLAISSKAETAYVDAADEVLQDAIDAINDVLIQSIENVAALASTPVVAGRVYLLKDYHAGTGFGGGELVGVSGSTTYDNGETFAGLGGHFRRINTVLDESHFGAIGNDITIDDYASLQAYFDYCAANTGYVFTNVELGSYTYFGARQGGFAQAKVYAISNTLVLPTNYDNFDFSHCLFVPHSTFTLSNFAFEITGWISKFSRLKLAKFTNGIDISNGNLDIGRVCFDQLDASAIDRLFLIECRSTLTTISNYRFDNVKIVAEIIDGDKVVFNDGWLSAGVLASTADAHFMVTSSNNAGLTLNDLLYVPTPQTALRTSIVRISGTAARVTLVDCLCGGEPGQIPLVANYVTGASGLARGCHITIDNCLGFTTDSGSAGGARPTVELYALPNSVVFQNFYGGSEETGAQGLVNYNTFVQSFAAAKAALGSAKFQLYINGRTPSNFIGLSSNTIDDIALFDCSSPETTRKLATGVTSTTGAVLFLKAEAGLTVTYKVSLFSVSNSGADRYSEYIISSDTAAAALSNWSIAPILLGASTFAGRLVINGGGDIEIINNSGAANDVLAVITKLSNTRIN